MAYFMEFSTSDGAGQMVSVQTAEVEGASVEVLDDTLDALKEALPVLTDVYHVMTGALLEAGSKLSPKETAKKMVEEVEQAAISFHAKEQLSALVEQCLTKEGVSIARTEFVYHMISSVVYFMGNVSKALHAGQPYTQIGSSNLTEGLMVEFVSTEEG